MHTYGINLETLGRFITTPAFLKRPWGAFRVIAHTPEFRFERWDIRAKKTAQFFTDAKREATIFVETGELAVGVKTLEEKQAMTLAPKKRAVLRAARDTALYVFRGPAQKRAQSGKPFRTSDFRDKYWGTIETIVSLSGYAAKRMLVKKECAASLEFHCRKLESYHIHSGTLLLRMRAGRGEDRFFEMKAGESALIPPGLMHQRGGVADAVIIEISTKDEDSDSFLVEDGAKHPMLRLTNDTRCLSPLRRPADEAGSSGTSGIKNARGKRICFDIDGVLCTQIADGEQYIDAKPNKDMIALVNKLYDEGNTIYLYTARFMGRNKNDWKRAYEDGYEFTKKQIEEWGVKHHKLFLGKPSVDLFIDDRALFYTPDPARIDEEIKKFL